jgi:hypothetical protein
LLVVLKGSSQEHAPKVGLARGIFCQHRQVRRGFQGEIGRSGINESVLLKQTFGLPTSETKGTSAQGTKKYLATS